MTKKVYKQQYFLLFSVITKNSNLEIVTKNLVLKDKMVLRIKNFNILRVHWRVRLYMGGGGVHEKPI